MLLLLTGLFHYDVQTGCEGTKLGVPGTKKYMIQVVVFAIGK